MRIWTMGSKGMGLKCSFFIVCRKMQLCDIVAQSSERMEVTDERYF